jgi:hypothetical protein
MTNSVQQVANVREVRGDVRAASRGRLLVDDIRFSGGRWRWSRDSCGVKARSPVFRWRSRPRSSVQEGSRA